MASIVLKDSPSDHRPFIQDFRFKGHVREHFRAVTFNVEHSNNAKSLANIFGEIAGYEVGVWLLQEVKPRRGIQKLLKKLGYASKRVAPEFCIAWDEAEWKYERSWRPLMSPTKYWTMNYALVVVLKHKPTGRLVKFMTYHPPAHVQSPRFKAHAKVMTVLRQAVRKWNRIARHNTARIAACCFAGDDNVDEFRGWAPKDEWEFMLNGPLEQVRAPAPTHDAHRKIDDFRVRGLQPI